MARWPLCVEKATGAGGAVRWALGQGTTSKGEEPRRRDAHVSTVWDAQCTRGAELYRTGVGCVACTVLPHSLRSTSSVTLTWKIEEG